VLKGKGKGTGGFLGALAKFSAICRCKVGWLVVYAMRLHRRMAISI